MPRTARSAVGGVIYHVLNRGNGRMRIFRKAEDYPPFLQLMAEAKERADVEIFGYCLMPNHWHVVLRPAGDEDLAAYFSWLTNTHVKRYRSHYQGTSGHLYQGRYKSFPVQQDAYLLTLLRYVEANPLRAKLVRRAEDWKWSSLAKNDLVDAWPIERPRNWRVLVNEPVGENERSQMKVSFERGRPLGEAHWVKKIAAKMGLESTMNERCRPKKDAK